MRSAAREWLLAVAAIAVSVSVAGASSFGIFDAAKPDQGCNWHHSGHPSALPNNTTTQVVVLGLPSAEGYVGGRAEPYRLTVLVLGTAIPAPQFAGFNLAATAGAFTGNATVQVRNETQCDELESSGLCEPGGAFDPCLTCDDTTPANATHTTSGPIPGSPLLRYLWEVDWTPPLPGTGAVTFYLAGNVVNGILANDAGDLWSVMDPVVVPEKSAP